MSSHERVMVGMVGDIRHLGLETPPPGGFPPDWRRSDINGGDLVMRTRVDP